MKSKHLNLLSSGDFDVFFSDHALKVYDSNVVAYVNSLKRVCFNDEKVVRLLSINSKARNLEKIAVLNAQGTDVDDIWMYYQDGLFSVQSWIRKNDGKYSTLIIDACNPKHSEIYSSKSAILVPNNHFMLDDVFQGTVQLELYIPNMRQSYIDKYLLEFYNRYLHLFIPKAIIKK